MPVIWPETIDVQGFPVLGLKIVVTAGDKFLGHRSDGTLGSTPAGLHCGNNGVAYHSGEDVEVIRNIKLQGRDANATKLACSFKRFMDHGVILHYSYLTKKQKPTVSGGLRDRRP